MGGGEREAAYGPSAVYSFPHHGAALVARPHTLWLTLEPTGRPATIGEQEMDCIHTRPKIAFLRGRISARHHGHTDAQSAAPPHARPSMGMVPFVRFLHAAPANMGAQRH